MLTSETFGDDVNSDVVGTAAADEVGLISQSGGGDAEKNGRAGCIAGMSATVIELLAKNSPTKNKNK